MTARGSKAIGLALLIIFCGIACKAESPEMEGSYSAFLATDSQDPIAADAVKYFKLRLRFDHRFDLDTGRGQLAGEWRISSQILRLDIQFINGKPAASEPHTKDTAFEWTYYVRDCGRSLFPVARASAAIGFRKD